MWNFKVKRQKETFNKFQKDSGSDVQKVMLHYWIL